MRNFIKSYFWVLAGCSLFCSVYADQQGTTERTLFNGQSLDNWEKTDYAGGGEVRLDGKGGVVLEFGIALTGIHWVGDELPKVNYELMWEAKKEMGSDFFASLTFPFRENHATLIVGGWGGALVGISSIDGFDASENETSTAHYFKMNQWYSFRLMVTENHFRFWVDDEKLIDFSVEGRDITMRTGEIEMSTPLGFSTYDTTGVVRNITLNSLR